MTTRRRFIGAAVAMGFLPAQALSQTPSKPQKYRCESQGELNGRKLWTHATGEGRTAESMTGQIVRPLSPTDFQTADGVSALAEEFKGYLKYTYKRESISNPALKPSELEFGAKAFTYGTMVNAHNKHAFIATFYDLEAEKQIFSTPINVKVDDKLVAAEQTLSSRGQNAQCDAMNNENVFASDPDSITANVFECKFDSAAGRQKLTFSVTLKPKDGVVGLLKDIQACSSRIAIFINDKNRGSDRGSALLAYADPGVDMNRIVTAMESEISDHIRKHAAGECAEFNSNCFLTTASSHTLGLPDDCWELETLRAFRDGPLQNMAGGPALIRQYYDEAPKIVAAMPRDDYARIWSRTWLFGVVPAALACRFGLNALALRLYRKMFNRLREQAGML